MNAPAPGWHPDPTARHEYRYWDGARWSDDVSDNGVTGVDPVGPGGLAGGPGGPGGGPGDPTAVGDPTRQFSNPPSPGGPGYGAAPGPGGAYGASGFGSPGAGAPPGPPYGPGGPGQSGPYPPYPGTGPVPPGGPRKSGPSTGLIAGIAALAVAVIAIVAFVVTSGDDDDTATDDTSDTTEETDGSSDTTEDTSDTTAGGDSGLPEGITEEQAVDAMADALETGGGFDRDTAECMSQAMLDQLGFEKLEEIGASDNPFSELTPEETSDLLSSMVDCGLTEMPTSEG
jgi:Protein of unknown function (DUF2510)